MTLQTRAPSRLVPLPTVLVEGEEKAGKTWWSLELSASERVGRTFAFDLGEGSVDEYGHLGRYEVAEWGGTYRGLQATLADARAEARPEPELPNVIFLDNVSALWLLLTEEADAKARLQSGNRKKLATDPDADIDITMNLWNDASSRWFRILRPLLAWDGIVVMTARGKRAAVVENGRPTGEHVWSVVGQRDLAYDVSAWVRCTRPRARHLVGVRSSHVTMPPTGMLPLGPELSLEALIFDRMKAGTGGRQITQVVATTSAARPKRQLLEAYMAAGWSEAQARGLARTAWSGAGLPLVGDVAVAAVQALVEAVEGPEDTEPGDADDAFAEPPVERTVVALTPAVMERPKPEPTPVADARTGELIGPSHDLMALCTAWPGPVLARARHELPTGVPFPFDSDALTSDQRMGVVAWVDRWQRRIAQGAAR